MRPAKNPELLKSGLAKLNTLPVAEKSEILGATEGSGFGVGFSGYPARWYYYFVLFRYRIAKPFGV